MKPAEEAKQMLLARRRELEGRARHRGSGGASGAEERELEEIEAALARIQAGRFGRCEQCGSAIGRLRLKAVPEARRCLSCAG